MPARRSINTHIVVVGGSECGLSVVESLLFSQSLGFTAITLLAPGGLPNDGVYSRTVLTRLVGFCDLLCSSCMQRCYIVWKLCPTTCSVPALVLLLC